MNNDFPEKIFSSEGEEEFQRFALEIFRFQADNNKVYNQFLKALGKDPGSIGSIEEIPFLPVEFFRSHKVLVDNIREEAIFESSTTAATTPSRHYVHDLLVYERSFNETFSLFYGNPEDYLIAALLPSYAERGNSSLIYMADKLIRESRYTASGFYHDQPGLIKTLEKAKSSGIKTLLLGVSFALLDLADKYSPDLSGIIVMETGGMKGRRKEITRAELHGILRDRFNIESVHSEYGMTELLSQAYSAGSGLFFTPWWLKILIRDPQDPFSLIREPGITGGINIIDLANFWSCSFIAVSDLGKLHGNGGFEVLGRFDSSDIRGCNLMSV